MEELSGVTAIKALFARRSSRRKKGMPKHMSKDTVVAFRAPDGFSPDRPTDLLRHGVRNLIAKAVEAELITFLAAHADQTDAAGRRRLVCDGHLPERTLQTGIGSVPVKLRWVRDRAPEGTPLRFASTILPSYLRRAKSIEEFLPWLYLKCISTGVFSDALLGPDLLTFCRQLVARPWPAATLMFARDLS
jgi:putative transposase